MTSKIHAGDRYFPCLLSQITRGNVDDSSDDENFLHDIIQKEVLLNLNMLFNSRMRRMDDEIKLYPEIKNSVVNFGLVDFCGMDCNEENFELIKREIILQISYFEPRLNADTVLIKRIESEKSDRCSFSLHIEAQFAIEEIKDSFECNFYMELETGKATFRKN